MKGPTSWSSRTAHHTMTMKRIWKLYPQWRGELSSDHTWELCLLWDTITTELRYVSNKGVTIQPVIAAEPLPNSSLWAKWPGPRCSTRCKWHAYIPSPSTELHTLVLRTTFYHPTKCFLYHQQLD
jgi:hypothetical protein